MLQYIEAQRGPAAPESEATDGIPSPPRYRNLRPITGSNTLLVKRLRSIDPAQEGRDGVCLTVRGDNPEVSLDSRQWGCLDPAYVVGRPLLRVLPLSRIGPVL